MNILKKYCLSPHNKCGWSPVEEIYRNHMLHFCIRAGFCKPVPLKNDIFDEKHANVREDTLPAQNIACVLYVHDHCYCGFNAYTLMFS